MTVMAVLGLGLVSQPASAMASPVSFASTQSSSSDFGVTLVDMFAFIGDVLSFFEDQIASEDFLPTACVQPC